MAVDELALRLGVAIRKWRRARNMTMQQLAAVAGVSQPFLSQIERGQARPSMGSLDRIALGISPAEPAA
ncbi:helix-turn-helix domain-containing protein [Desertimonas flava]|uniref:helix-turn-helix domain-containing protein n=1 Tax=Desertimonas flava TaxID=2064846 RepID=UPI000E345609|nr:helix-turn-helix transcriptional regulator [Desertimonas flava]